MRVAAQAAQPLVLHILFRFATGGLENGVVNLINHMPEERLRHAILAVDDIDPDFVSRLRRQDLPLLALRKPPGHAWRQYGQVVRMIRSLAPAIVHTRNLAAMELLAPAWFAGVPVRLHGEHGRDDDDIEGRDRRKQLLRRLYSPLVHRYTTVSRDLQRYLVERVHVDADRITQIYNGVDTARFRPRGLNEPLPQGFPFDLSRHWVIGCVGRLQAVKNQRMLVRAFARALSIDPAMKDRARLALIGDGPLLGDLQRAAADAGLGSLVWIPGARVDVPQLMRTFSVFALPSHSEGVSNTILEAMASGLPIVATNVGGNGELLESGRTGILVPSDDDASMAASLAKLFRGPALAAEMGRSAHATVQLRFSLGAMVDAYSRLYRSELARVGYCAA